MIRDALVIGINTYSYERLSNLTAPAQDAEAVAKLLEDYGEFNVKRLPGVKDKQNNTIRVGQKTQVTLTQLEDAIVQLFKPEGRNIPDTALLYFSGHGLRKNQGIQEGFLASSDTNPYVGNWGLRLKWLRELLQESEVRQQIIWLDCCYSGELLNFAEADPGDRGKGRDRCFIAASREFELAFVGIGTNHSVFTTALLQALEPRENQQRVTNYTIVDAISQNIAKFPQLPIFASGTNLSGAKLQGVIYNKETKFPYGFLPASQRMFLIAPGANLRLADLSGANLRFANLSGANLSNADLSGANLRFANLSGANLRFANLSDANLGFANLSGADLSGVSFFSADLEKTDLSGALLYSADLRSAYNEAYFNKAKNLTTEQVKSANSWQKAGYDEGFRKQLGLK